MRGRKKRDKKKNERERTEERRRMTWKGGGVREEWQKEGGGELLGKERAEFWLTGPLVPRGVSDKARMRIWWGEEGWRHAREGTQRWGGASDGEVNRSSRECHGDVFRAGTWVVGAQNSQDQTLDYIRLIRLLMNRYIIVYGRGRWGNCKLWNNNTN